MAVAQAPRSPVTGSPERRPGSVRRTSHVDMVFEAAGEGGESDDGASLHLSGRARDLVTSTGTAAAATVTGEASVDAVVFPGFGGDQRLVRLVTDPDRPALSSLVGTPVRSGLRRALPRVVPEDEGTPLGLLLDELPVATLISGYATMRSEALKGAAGRPGAPAPVRPGVPGVADRMTDMCSGWRADGIAIASMRANGALPMQDCPPAPPLDGSSTQAADGQDPMAWHDQPVLPVGAMRRRRRVDVVAEESGWAVDAMFRDTFGEPEGHEGVLHEYSLTASVAPDLTIAAIAAEARVLPFPECPWAAPNVTRLVSLPVANLRTAVPDLLAGVAGCTHLNDLLRALADVAWLVDSCG